MRECVAVRHVAFEDAGLLADLLQARGFSLRYIEAGVEKIERDTLLAADLVIVLGGPIGVYEEEQYPFLRGEIAAVRARLEAQKPMVGICLGAQLMAYALGAEVKPGPEKEIGWAPVELTEAGKQSVLAPLQDVPVLHWHGDGFGVAEGAENLAKTRVCPHQAFRIGRHALGLQFHIEANPARIEQWLIGHAVELGKAGIDPRDIRKQTLELGARPAEAGRKVFEAWLDGALA
jgi:GMP synthase (glutamine-hydrolysing)